MIIVDKIIDEQLMVRLRKPGVIRASELGHPCTRRLQYHFHNPRDQRYEGLTCFVLESGIRGEDVFIERLPDGYQIIKRQEEYKLNELEGHIDGVLVTPSGEQYLWEHKVCGQDKFNKVKDGISLMSWDSQYYTQAFVYMMLSGIKQHLTTIELSGGRDYREILTIYEPAHEELIKAKIESIKSEVMMPPLPKWQQNIYCKGCEYYDRCLPTTSSTNPTNPNTSGLSG